MADSAGPNRLNEAPSSHENLRTPERDNRDRQVDSLKESGRAAFEGMTLNGVESAEDSESVEAMGHVSERAGIARDQKGDGSSGAATKSSKTDPAAIKAKLLKNLPTPEKMKQQITKEIEKEIDYLHSRAVKMSMAPGEVNYFELSNIMKKIRELKGILAILAKASLERLKTLWLRFVHGVM